MNPRDRDPNEPLGHNRDPLRVVVAAPLNAVGGQAHAAKDIIHGFLGTPSVIPLPVAIDPRLPGLWRWLTTFKGVRSIVRPALYAIHLFRVGRTADVFHIFCAAHLAFLFGALPAILVAGLCGDHSSSTTTTVALNNTSEMGSSCVGCQTVKCARGSIGVFAGDLQGMGAEAQVIRTL